MIGMTLVDFGILASVGFPTLMILSRLATGRIGGVGKVAKEGVDAAATANRDIAALTERVKDAEEKNRDLDRETREAERQAAKAILSASEAKANYLQLFVLKGDYAEREKRIEDHLVRIETKLDAIKEKK